MGEVDTAFIQEPLNRAKLCVIEAEEIPVIDLSPITNKAVADSSSIEGLVKEIGFACKEWGFFQVINHGVPQSLRENIEKASRMFFGQSVEEKRKVSRNERNAMGYYDTEHTKNVRDWKEVFDSVAKDPTLVPLTTDENDDRLTHWTNSSPQYPPHFRIAGLVWKQCFTWLGIMSVDHVDPVSHFLQFNLLNASAQVKVVWSSVWIIVVNEIWKHRNKHIFQGGVIKHS